MSNANTTARFAGVTYLVLILLSIAGYATMSRLLAGSAQVVVARLTASHALFTFAFASMAIGFLAWVVLAFLLYRLMRAAGPGAAFLLLTCALAGVAMNLAALSRLLPLAGLAGAALDAAAVAPMVLRYERLLLLAQVFSGLWLFPFGTLVLRSRVAPRLLGVCLLVGGFAYLLVFATAFAPGVGETTLFQIVGTGTFVASGIGEFGMCLWLLIKGAMRMRPPRAA